MIYDIGVFDGSYNDVQESTFKGELAYYAKTMLDNDMYAGLKLLWKETRFKVEGEKVTVDTITCTVDNVNNIFFLLNIYTSGDFGDFAVDNYTMIPEVITNVFKDVGDDSGQAKILIGMLEALAFAPRELNLLIIGSSSSKSSVGGKSYDVIALTFTKLGYYGIMDLYDPDEIDQVHKSGSFLMRHYAKKHIYSQRPIMVNNGKEIAITAIFDDCWSICEEQIVPDFKHIAYGQVVIPEGSSKFVVTRTNDLIGGLRNHVDNRNGKSGGSIMRNTKERLISVYRTSNTYGPFDRNEVFSILKLHFPTYTINVFDSEERSFDPNYSILLNTCRVSTKLQKDYRQMIVYDHAIDSIDEEIALNSYNHDSGYDRKLSNTRVVDQYYYSGMEKRIFKNIPKLSTKNFQVGDSCRTCRHLGKILASINVYNSVSVTDVVTEVMSSVLDKTCFKSVGQVETKNVISIREMARRQVSWDNFKENTLSMSSTKRRMMMRVAGIRKHERKLTLVKLKKVNNPFYIAGPPLFSIIDYPGFIQTFSTGNRQYYDGAFVRCSYPTEKFVMFKDIELQANIKCPPFASRILANHGSFGFLQDEIGIEGLYGLVEKQGKDVLTVTNSNVSASYIITNSTNKQWVSKLELTHVLQVKFGNLYYYEPKSSDLYRIEKKFNVKVDKAIDKVAISTIVEDNSVTFRLGNGRFAIQTSQGIEFSPPRECD